MYTIVSLLTPAFPVIQRSCEFILFELLINVTAANPVSTLLAATNCDRSEDEGTVDLYIGGRQQDSSLGLE